MALNNEGFSIEITADTKSFNQKLEQARRNLEKFKREAGSVMINGGAGGSTTGGNSSLTIQRKFNASISAMSTAVDAATRSIIRFSSALNASAMRPQRVINAASEGAAVARSGGGMTLLPSAFMLAAGAGVPLYKGFAEFSAREKLRVDLGTLLRDDARGADMASRITKYAAATPYGQNDLAGTVKTLLQYGANENEAEKYMRQIGDVALGNKNQMNSLGLVLGQVKSAGALKGQDLLQFINAGWNPLATLSEITGQGIGELKEAASKGAITFEHVAAALEKATSEGGQFYKGAERGSKTLAVLWSTLQDKIATALSEIVGSGENSIKTLMETWIAQDWSGIIAGGAEAFRSLVDVFKKLAKVFSFLVSNADKLVGALEIIARLAIAQKFIDIAAGMKSAYNQALLASSGIDTLRGKLSALGKTSVAQAGLVAASTWAIGKIMEAGDALLDYANEKLRENRRNEAGVEMNHAIDQRSAENKTLKSLEASMTAEEKAGLSSLPVGTWTPGSVQSANRNASQSALKFKPGQIVTDKMIEWMNVKARYNYWNDLYKENKDKFNRNLALPWNNGKITEALSELERKVQAEAKNTTPIIIDKSKKEVKQTNNIKVDESRFAKVVRDNLEMLLTSHFKIDRDLIATQAGA